MTWGGALSAVRRVLSGFSGPATGQQKAPHGPAQNIEAKSMPDGQHGLLTDARIAARAQRVANRDARLAAVYAARLTALRDGAVQ